MSAPHLIFVCWGNICRSPMGEVVAREFAARRGLDITVSSAGVSSEELGNPIDHRAAKRLTKAGYTVPEREAQRITASDIMNATLVVAAEQHHLDKMAAISPEATNLRLISDWIPGAQPGDPLPDPWYGGKTAFIETLEAIEAAVPGILDTVVEMAAAESTATSA